MWKPCCFTTSTRFHFCRCFATHLPRCALWDAVDLQIRCFNTEARCNCTALMFSRIRIQGAPSSCRAGHGRLKTGKLQSATWSEWRRNVAASLRGCLAKIGGNAVDSLLLANSVTRSWNGILPNTSAHICILVCTHTTGSVTHSQCECCSGEGCLRSGCELLTQPS
jgi:hypothetical protein